MKPRQVLGKYFEVYGQRNQITPEAGEKRLLFCQKFQKTKNKNFKCSIIWPEHCYEPPKRIFDSFDFYGYGSRFCLRGQKSLKSPYLAFTPK